MTVPSYPVSMLEEKSLKELTDTYGVPVAVRKKRWFDNFYYVVERVTSSGITYGKRYRNNVYYDDWSCFESDVFLLNNPAIGQKKAGDVVKPQSSCIGVLQKANLNTDKNFYVKRVTKLFVLRDRKVIPAIFDHFDTKNGKSVIYVECNGIISFYAFPNTKYAFSNENDALDAMSKRKRKEQLLFGENEIFQIIRYFKKLPTAIKPNPIKATDLQFEREHHRTIDEYLASKLSAEENKKKTMADEIEVQIPRSFREACIEARENGQILDDQTITRYQGSYIYAHRMLKKTDEKIDSIISIKSEPFFARVDCGENLNSLYTVYIGNKSIEKYVLDWRNPAVGNVYYHSNILRASDDLTIALKRTFYFMHCQLENYDDEINQYYPESDAAAGELNNKADALLTRLLSMYRENKATHDIIKTIQSEQYDIITSDFNKNSVINGCAGSGKTMILYHRLSYISYNYQFRTGQKFDPQYVFVITPSAYFNLANNDLLNKLSINGIHHATLETHIGKLIQKYCEKNNLTPFYKLKLFSSHYDTSPCNPYNEQTFGEFMENVNSIDTPEAKTMYTGWIIHTANEILTQNGFNSFNVADNFHTVDAFAPLYRSECFVKKEAKNNEDLRVEYFTKNIITGLHYEYDSLLESLKSLDKTKRTYLARTNALKKYKNLLSMCISQAPKQYSAGYSKKNIEDFWKLLAKPEIFEKMCALIIAEKLFTIANGEKNAEDDYLLRCSYAFYVIAPVNFSKIAELYFLRALSKKYGAVIKKHSFVFLDEFQNYSVFEIQCVKDAFENPTFNLYGDFDQQIEQKGSELRSALDKLLSPQMFNLNINYRNARQITQYINKKTNKNMIPIGINGKVFECHLTDCKFIKENRTAIIVKNIDSARNVILPYLSVDYRRISEKDTIDGDEILLLSVSESKGLEFDTVYVFEQGMTNNEKYVAYTRALDKLIVINGLKANDVVAGTETCSVQTLENREKQPSLFGEKEKESELISEEYLSFLLTMVNSWKALNVDLFSENLKKEFSESQAEKILTFIEEKQSRYRSLSLCQHCGGEFKGIFIKRCKRCGKRKDYR